MKLPFLIVSRSAMEERSRIIEEAWARCREEREDAKRTLAAERERYDRLFAAYERLRIEKLANPARLVTDEQVERIEEEYHEDDMPMEIAMAIDERAAGDGILQRELWKTARRMLSRKDEAAEVAKRILDGDVNDD